MALALFFLPPTLQSLGALPGACHLGVLTARGCTTHLSIPASPGASPRTATAHARALGEVVEDDVCLSQGYALCPGCRYQVG